MSFKDLTFLACMLAISIKSAFGMHGDEGTPVRRGFPKPPPLSFEKLGKESKGQTSPKPDSPKIGSPKPDSPKPDSPKIGSIKDRGRRSSRGAQYYLPPSGSIKAYIHSPSPRSRKNSLSSPVRTVVSLPSKCSPKGDESPLRKRKDSQGNSPETIIPFQETRDLSPRGRNEFSDSVRGGAPRKERSMSPRGIPTSSRMDREASPLQRHKNIIIFPEYTESTGRDGAKSPARVRKNSYDSSGSNQSYPLEEQSGSSLQYGAIASPRGSRKFLASDGGEWREASSEGEQEGWGKARSSRRTTGEGLTGPASATQSFYFKNPYATPSE